MIFMKLLGILRGLVLGFDDKAVELVLVLKEVRMCNSMLSISVD